MKSATVIPYLVGLAVSSFFWGFVLHLAIVNHTREEIVTGEVVQISYKDGNLHDDFCAPDFEAWVSVLLEDGRPYGFWTSNEVAKMFSMMYTKGSPISFDISKMKPRHNVPYLESIEHLKAEPKGWPSQKIIVSY